VIEIFSRQDVWPWLGWIARTWGLWEIAWGWHELMWSVSHHEHPMRKLGLGLALFLSPYWVPLLIEWLTAKPGP